MQIKDTKIYIKDILLEGKDITVNPLIGDTNPILQKFIGRAKKTKNYIEQIGSFVAKDSNQQMIYEFLQNADDANNDNENNGSFGLFYNTEYLLVVNNGKPFSMKANGDLKSFLSHEDGKKQREVENVKGKFGKGSKLLYNLLIDRNKKYSDDAAERISAIYDRLKGPIIYSWANSGEISKLGNNTSFTREEPNNDSYPLLTKIIHGYYPAYPGEIAATNTSESGELFPIVEIEELAKFIKNIDDDFYTTFKNRGSLIFIKLGKNQYETLESNKLFVQSLRNFILFSKNLKYIYFQNQKIHKTDFLSTSILECSPTVKKFKYEIIFPSDDMEIKELNLINFHNLLPVVGEQHGLKFIIDTDHFALTPDRQFIKTESAYSIERFKEISDLLYSYLANNNIEFSNRLWLYKSIIASDTEHSQKQEIKDFYINLLSKVKTIAPINNRFVNNENVVINNSNQKIDLSVLGLNKYKWLAKETSQFYNLIESKAEIEKWNLISTLSKANNDRVRDWISSLNYYQYIELVNEMSTFSYQEYQDIPFIKSSDNNVYSLNEYKSKSAFFLLSDNSIIKSLLIDIGGVVNESFINNIIDSINEEQIDKIISFFNEKRNKIVEDRKQLIVKYLNEKYNENTKISTELNIFKNRKSEYCNLSNLFNDDSISKNPELINFALIKNSEHYPILNDLYFDKSKLWNKMLTNWQNINISVENQTNYINSIAKIYECADNGCANNISDIKIIPDSANKLCSRNEIFLHQSLASFNIEQYNILLDIFENIDVSLPNYSHREDLLKQPFYIETSQMSDIKENINNTFTTDTEGLKVFKQLVEQLTNSFFNHFNIKKEDEEYRVFVNENKAKQYFSEDEDFNTYLGNKDNYILLPQELKVIFENYKNEDDIIDELIEIYEAPKEFINVILNSDRDSTKKLYLNAINKFDLISTQDYNVTSFEYKTLELSAKIEYTEISSKFYIDDNHLSKYQYTDNMIVRIPNGQNVHFKLSEILTEYSGKTDAIDRIRSQFNSINGIDQIFNSRNITNTELWNKLEQQNQFTAMQICYIIANKIAGENALLIENHSIPEEMYPQILELLYRKELSDFHEYYKFNIDTQSKILSKEFDYLLESEYTPNWILSWINIDDERKRFITKFITSHSDVINFRKDYQRQIIDDTIQNPRFIINTLKWITQQNEELSTSGIKNLKKIIKSYVESENALPEYLIMFNTTDTYKLNYLNERACFINKVGSNVNQIEELISNADFDYQIINNEYPKIEENTFNDFNIYKLEIKASLNQNMIKNPEEWEEDYYKEWKETKEGDKYTISILTSRVPLEYTAHVEDSYFKIYYKNSGDVSSIKENSQIGVFLSTEFIQSEDKPILTILEEQKQDTNIKDADLLKLQSIYINNIEKFNKAVNKANIIEEDILIISKNKEKFKQFKEYVENGKGIGNILLDKDLSIEDQQRLNKLFNNFSIEDIESKMKTKNEEPDAQINSLTGYIGEMVFQKYLECTNRTNIIYVADECAEYDFVSPKEEIYIDTKTTIKSVNTNNDAVPFYIKKSQYEFLQNKQPEQYYIARLSLKDILLDTLQRNYEVYNNAVDIPVEVKSEIKKEVGNHFENQNNIELLKNTMMIFKLNYDNVF